MRDHRKLRAFELADELVLLVYKATVAFPRDEQFGLTSQLRRACVSVASNIVEGAARNSQADFVRFLDIAFASLREAEYQITIAARLRYLNDTIARELAAKADEAARVLSGLIRSMRAV